MTNDEREALMDVPQMIARAQYWHGWCIDNEIQNGELVRLRYLLNSVIGHLQDERDAVFEQAHTPTDDERETLVEEATWALIEWDTDTVDRGVRDEHYRERRADIERVFPILFRRPVQGEPATRTAVELEVPGDAPTGVAVQGEPEWEYGVRFTGGPDRLDPPEYIYCWPSLGMAEDQAALNPEHEAEFVRRRKAGPWLEVTK